MNVKAIIYILITPFIIYCMDSLNLNYVFKKNKIAQARILYLLVGLALSYLVVNFIYDFYEVSQII